MSGRFIISLDFELMWGVRDHRSVADYGDAVLGGRAAIPAILKLFAEKEIRATWATVGFIFARTRSEILDHAPALRPAYADVSSSPYAFVETGLGKDENEDPLHFGQSLLERIADTEGQEIATHSFSHFCCLEPGHTPEAFAADLVAARGIAEAKGHKLQSIVFARNQMNDRYIAIAAEHGMRAFRGNPTGFAYRPRAAHETHTMVRAIRLLDSVLPIAGRTDFARLKTTAGSVNARASRFLRPFNRRLRALSWLQTRRICDEIERAAIDQNIYHLWWHPHNMGRNTRANLAQLQTILTHFTHVREQYGMQSCSMADVSRLVS